MLGPSRKRSRLSLSQVIGFDSTKNTQLLSPPPPTCLHPFPNISRTVQTHLPLLPRPTYLRVLPSFPVFSSYQPTTSTSSPPIQAGPVTDSSSTWKQLTGTLPLSCQIPHPTQLALRNNRHCCPTLLGASFLGLKPCWFPF